jgi:hypothetical protein
MAIVNLSETVPKLVSQGFDEILRGLGNNVYGLAGANNSADQNQFMTNMIVSNNDQFLNNKWILDMKDFNAFWYGVFFLGFILIGAALVWSSNNQNPFIKSSVMDSNDYIKTIITGLIVFLFAFYGMDYILKLEYLISQGIVLETFNILPPASENPIAYIIGAIIYLFLSVFFMVRYFIVGLTISFLLFLLGLSLFPFARNVINEVLAYAALMLFSRFILAAVIAGGMALIQALPAGLSGNQMPYLVLGLVACIVALVLLLGPVTVLKIAKTGVKTL